MSFRKELSDVETTGAGAPKRPDGGPPRNLAGIPGRSRSGRTAQERDRATCQAQPSRNTAGGMPQLPICPYRGVPSRCAQLIDSHEQERRQVAGDLHDGIGQMLGAIKYRLEAAIQTLQDGGPVSACVALSGVVTTIQCAVEEVRRIALRLRPSILDDLGLIPTIDWFARDFRGTYTEIRLVTQVCVLEDEIPEDLKLVIYRLIQEALHNVAKHAVATAAWIELVRAGGELTLRIADNGTGFAADSSPPEGQNGGLGLNGMRERVQHSRGSLAVHTVPGEGTVIIASWPMDPHSAVHEAILDGECGQRGGVV